MLSKVVRSHVEAITAGFLPECEAHPCDWRVIRGVFHAFINLHDSATLQFVQGEPFGSLRMKHIRCVLVLNRLHINPPVSQ